MTARTVYALVHLVCGHAGGVANNREQLDAQRALLAAHGRYSWTVREATTADMQAVVLDRKCRTCDLTPAGLL